MEEGEDMEEAWWLIGAGKMSFAAQRGMLVLIGLSLGCGESGHPHLLLILLDVEHESFCVPWFDRWACLCWCIYLPVLLVHVCNQLVLEATGMSLLVLCTTSKPSGCQIALGDSDVLIWAR